MSAVHAVVDALADVLSGGPVSEVIDLDSIARALERARVVAVLDGWAGRQVGAMHKVSNWGGRSDPWTVNLVWENTARERESREYYGPTPDAARAAAAIAVEKGEV